MEILNKKSEEIVSFLSVLDESLDSIKVALTNRTPHLKGEKYLTNNDVSKLLNISIRTLQYRNIILICNKLSRYIDITGNDIETTKPHYPALIFIDSNNSVGHCFRFPLQELYMRLSPHTAQAIQSSNLLNLS